MSENMRRGEKCCLVEEGNVVVGEKSIVRGGKGTGDGEGKVTGEMNVERGISYRKKKS